MHTTLSETNLKHLQFVWNRKSFPKIMELGVFPDPKEMSESVAAYLHTAEYLKVNKGDKSVIVYVVGDGNSPRTAALMTFFSNWTMVSIDPNMKKNPQKIASILKTVQRLSVSADIVENFKVTGEQLKYDTVVVACVHSHAPMNETIETLLRPYLSTSAKLGLITIPCCFPETLLVEPTYQFSDEGILSAKRTVKIYNNDSIQRHFKQKDLT